MIDHTTPRIIEAYVGEYASGKSEIAINRALQLHKEGLQVHLVDLDTVEPVYTLRPLKKELTELGLHVVAWETHETVGLGEAGSVMHPAMRWALINPGNVIMDVGYGVHGADIFNLIEGATENPFLKIIAVINASRPMTSTVPAIVEYVQGLGRVDAVMNNTHMDMETTAELVQIGADKVFEASKELGIPMIATGAMEEIANEIGTHDRAGCEVRKIKRFMPRAFW